MSPVVIGALIGAVLTLLLILANEVFGLLSSDRFPNAAFRWSAYLWFGLLSLFLGMSVAGSAGGAAEIDIDQVQFYGLFVLHLALMIFLAGWWVLSGRKPVLDFMNLRTDSLARDTAIGLFVGFGGWLFTMTAALTVSLIVQQLGLLPDDAAPPAMVDYMVNLAIWQKLLIILSAMTVEEFFYRGWLQKRFGLIVSTVVFAISHAGYGQPMFLIGVTAISLVIGVTFYYTRRLWPCIVAHGVFDAIQLLVIVPLITKYI